MAPIAETIFLHSLLTWKCHVRFSSIYTLRDFTQETCSIAKLSMESSSVPPDRVFNLSPEPININWVFAAFKVSLLASVRSKPFSQLFKVVRKTRLNKI